MEAEGWLTAFLHSNETMDNSLQ